MPDDFSAVTGTFSGLTTPSGTPTGYTAGDTMKVTIGGQAVQTSGQTTTLAVTLAVTAADGSTGQVVVNVPLTKNVATPESVTLTGVTDNGGTGRVWTVGADHISATATA